MKIIKSGILPLTKENIAEIPEVGGRFEIRISPVSEDCIYGAYTDNLKEMIRRWFEEDEPCETCGQIKQKFMYYEYAKN